VAQRLPARRAMIRAVRFSPDPIPLYFTSWIDTLNGGARHHGHSELPQRPPAHSFASELPLAARNSLNGPSGLRNLPSVHVGRQQETTPIACGRERNLWKNVRLRNPRPSLWRLGDTFPFSVRPKEIPPLIGSGSKNSQVPKQNSQGRKSCQTQPSTTQATENWPLAPIQMW